MTVRPPEDSPGSLSAIGNDEALRMEGFFAACGLPDILERSPRGERPHGSETSSLPDGGPGQTLLKVRNGIRLPCRSIPKPEHHGPLVRQDGLPPPPASDHHETGRLPGSFRASSRRRPRPGTSNTPFTSRRLKRMSGIHLAIPVFSKGYRPKQGKVAP